MSESSQPPRNRNSDVARLLEEIGDLLEIKGEGPFRVNAYRSAGRKIEGLRESIEVIHAEGKLRSIQGVGPALAQKIGEFLDTGRLGYVEKLRADVPSGVAELLKVPGLGPRTARQIFDSIGVQSLAELETAARGGRIRDISGLGARTEERILAELEKLKERSGRHQLGLTMEIGTELAAQLLECPAVSQAAVVGSVRRMVDTIGNVNLLVASTRPAEVQRFVHSLEQVRSVVEGGRWCAEIEVRRGVRVDVRVVEPAAWGAALLWHTGSSAHNTRLQQLAQERGWTLDERGLDTGPYPNTLRNASENDIYEALGLQPIPPELREDWGEVELAQQRNLPRLIELADLRGDLHVHSDWSDGSDSIERMALAARALGHEYMALTDHSKSLGVARGLTEERVVQQRAVIDALNQQLAPFRVFHGTEMDIKRDGLLDYADVTLATFDYVSASIHSAMNQDRETMTARIQRAIRNPWVVTLNHPHGRLVGSREPYAVDMDAVIATAVEEGTALEINSQPERMDLDGASAHRAKLAGARFTISTDSHGWRQLEMRHFGIGTARRAWLGPADVLNTLNRDQFAEYLAARRQRAEA